MFVWHPDTNFFKDVFLSRLQSVASLLCDLHIYLLSEEFVLSLKSLFYLRDVCAVKSENGR